MKIVIIEDERMTALDLKQSLLQIDSTIREIDIVRSVKEGKEYFNREVEPDLIFSDIRLGDGLSFDIISQVKAPVIFCTAYDEYMLNAFNTNGIGYILKPFSDDSVSDALQKYKSLIGIKEHQTLEQQEILKKLFSTISKVKISSILTYYKDIVMPVRIVDIAMFYLKDSVVHLYTFDKKTNYPNKSLDELEELIGNQFYRVNRQYLVNKKAILHASSLLSRKMSVAISVPHNESITISREKSSHFLKWLQEE